MFHTSEVVARYFPLGLRSISRIRCQYKRGGVTYRYRLIAWRGPLDSDILHNQMNS
jgi:hypothetical protein